MATTRARAIIPGVPRKPRIVIDQDATGDFLDKPDIVYEGGRTREQVLRDQGIDPSDPEAVKAALRADGIEPVPLPPPVPK